MLGILFAMGALLAWAFGDFYMQKTAKAVCIWKTPFYIAFTGAVLLFPVVSKELPAVMADSHQESSFSQAWHKPLLQPKRSLNPISF